MFDIYIERVYTVYKHYNILTWLGILGSALASNRHWTTSVCPWYDAKFMLVLFFYKMIIVII